MQAQKTSSYEEHENSNRWMASILDPFTISASKPSLGTVCCGVNKNVVSSIVYSPARDRFMVVVNFSEPKFGQCMRLYLDTAVKNVSNRPWTVVRDALNPFKLDQDLSQWAWLDLVSAGFGLQSDTLTGNNFTVSGTVNAMHTSAPFAFEYTQFEALSALKDNQCCFTSTSVANGVVVLKPPSDSDKVLASSQRHVGSFDQCITIPFPITYIAQTGSLTAGSSKEIYDITLDPELVPYPTFGWIEVNLNIPLVVTSTTGSGGVGTGCFRTELTVSTVSTDATGANQTSTDHTFVETYYFAGLNGSVFQMGPNQSTGRIYFYEEIYRVRFTIYLTHGDTWDFFAHTDPFFGINPSIYMNLYTMANWGQFFPASFVAVSGVNVGQTINAIAAVNISAVPKGDLAKDVQSTISPPNYEDYITALTVSAKVGSPEVPIRWVWPKDVYQNFVQRTMHTVVERGRMRALSSSFGDFLKSVLPIVGGIGTSLLLGPESAPMGMALGEGISRAFSSSSRKRAFASDRAIAYSASGDETEKVVDSGSEIKEAKIKGMNVTNDTSLLSTVLDLCNRVATEGLITETDYKSGEPYVDNYFSINKKGRLELRNGLVKNCSLLTDSGFVFKTKRKVYMDSTSPCKLLARLRGGEKGCDCRIYQMKHDDDVFVCLNRDEQGLVIFVVNASKAKSANSCALAADANAVLAALANILSDEQKAALAKQLPSTLTTTVESSVDQPLRVRSSVTADLAPEFRTFLPFLAGEREYASGEKKSAFAGKKDVPLFSGIRRDGKPVEKGFNPEVFIGQADYLFILKTEQGETVERAQMLVTNVPVYAHEEAYTPYEYRTGHYAHFCNLLRDGDVAGLLKKIDLNSLICFNTGAKDVYVTPWMADGRLKISTVGTSWHAAFVASATYLPRFAFYTGGTTLVTRLSDKINLWSGINSVDNPFPKPLIIVNAEETPMTKLANLDIPEWRNSTKKFLDLCQYSKSLSLRTTIVELGDLNTVPAAAIILNQRSSTPIGLPEDANIMSQEDYEAFKEQYESAKSTFLSHGKAPGPYLPAYNVIKYLSSRFVSALQKQGRKPEKTEMDNLMEEFSGKGPWNQEPVLLGDGKIRWNNAVWLYNTLSKLEVQNRQYEENSTLREKVDYFNRTGMVMPGTKKIGLSGIDRFNKKRKDLQESLRSRVVPSASYEPDVQAMDTTVETEKRGQKRQGEASASSRVNKRNAKTKRPKGAQEELEDEDGEEERAWLAKAGMYVH